MAMAAAQQAAAQVYHQFASLSVAPGPAAQQGGGAALGSSPDSSGLGELMMAGGGMNGGMGGAPGYGGGFGPLGDGFGAADGEAQLEVMKELMAMASRQDSPAVAMWALQQLQAMVGPGPGAGAGGPSAYGAPDLLSAFNPPGAPAFPGAGPEEAGEQPLGAFAAKGGGASSGGAYSNFGGGPGSAAGSDILGGSGHGGGHSGHGGGHGGHGGLAHWGSAAGSELQRALSGFSLASESSAAPGPLAGESSELSLAHSPSGSARSGSPPLGAAGAGLGASSILPSFDRPPAGGAGVGAGQPSPVLPRSWRAVEPRQGGGSGGAGAGTGTAGSGTGAPGAAPKTMFQLDPVVASPGRFRRIKKGRNAYYSTQWGAGGGGGGGGAASEGAGAGVPDGGAVGVAAKYGVDVPTDGAPAAEGLAAAAQAKGAAPGYDSA
jgi:hypothetical protein